MLINEVQNMIEFLMVLPGYLGMTLELCMLRRKMSFEEELNTKEKQYLAIAQQTIFSIIKE